MKKNNLNKKIGDAIRLHRLIRKVSRKQLGEKLGVSYQQIQNYESGKHRISAASLLKISQELNFPIQNFFSNGK
jgi:transcriptional regulator with XRE-family HTH domain